MVKLSYKVNIKLVRDISQFCPECVRGMAQTICLLMIFYSNNHSLSDQCLSNDYDISNQNLVSYRYDVAMQAYSIISSCSFNYLCTFAYTL